MPPRIPTEADFASLNSTLPHTLHFPSPPEATTAILILFHGLGDSHAGFSPFARGMNLPGVLAITVRGTSPLPLGIADGGGSHWGDDLVLDQGTGALDADPGYGRAERLIMDKLVGEVIVGKCGWELGDILLFGFGQGGSLALGLASRLRGETPRVVDVTDAAASAPTARPAAFKGAVSIGGPLPTSMVPTVSSRPKAPTKVLVVQLVGEAVAAVKREFEDVRVVNWKRREIAMPRDREEMLPIMKFLADRLNSGWQ